MSKEFDIMKLLLEVKEHLSKLQGHGRLTAPIDEILKGGNGFIEYWNEHTDYHPGKLSILPETRNEVREVALKFFVYGLFTEAKRSRNAFCPGCGKDMGLCPECKVMADNSNFM